MGNLKPFENFDPNNEYDELMEAIPIIEGLQSRLLGDFLNSLLKPTSIIDIGCGPGNYLIPFSQNGNIIFGIDACPTAGKFLDKTDFEKVDLRFPYIPKQKYDLALCIETAEHIEEEYADIFLDTVVSSADNIFFTAATPGQRGSYHFNEQPHSYWIKKFQERGYEIHPFQSSVRIFLNSNSHNLHGWLVNNSFLYTKKV